MKAHLIHEAVAVVLLVGAVRLLVVLVREPRLGWLRWARLGWDLRRQARRTRAARRRIERNNEWAGRQP